MSSTPFMQLYVNDYLSDTLDLTTEQHGAYLLLIMTMWRNGASLPSEAQKLARIARCNARRWHLVWPEIERFFYTADDGSLRHQRVDEEHQKATLNSAKRSASGRQGGIAKALKSKEPPLANATVLPEHSQKSDIIKKEEGASHPTRASKTAFDEWWEMYPHKMQKAAGKKAFEKAIKRASLAELKAGVERYIRDKPPELNWRYPATWLNGDGWLDQPAPPTGNSTMDQLNQMGREYVSGQETGNGDWSDVGRVFSREDPRLEGKGFPFLIDHKNGRH